MVGGYMIKFKKDLSSKTYLSDGCIIWGGGNLGIKVMSQSV
ncbi:hypothetical protein LILPAPAWES_54 [Morganella phage vB_MmoP_Lilpapawes]|uniref:Uncharacterized protein n=1 Tax=Morganella phage vB_MmoP_Lilpapawes TaxID=2894803 RepID=A0AAE9CBG7_9CAUD|nr:hypothetical protein LILPAPAWES_54 [Morganella phage vB_MmoP_Lilpapawes]